MILESCVLGVHLLTYHFIAPKPGDPPYHTWTPGIYAECDDWTAGYVRNSFGHPSEYVGYNVWRTESWSVTLGAAHGYRASPIIPLLALNYKIGKVRWTLLPNDHGLPLALSLGFQF